MKILITGVHGFVGTNLVEYLRKDNEIYGLDIIAPVREGVVRTFSWEELEQGLVPDVDAIVHLAGKAHDTKNKSVAEAYFKINTGLTQKIYDYFLASGVKKFIFFSTAKAAADRVDGVLTEEVVPSPVGPYGESKILAEKYILERLPQIANIHDSVCNDGEFEEIATAAPRNDEKEAHIDDVVDGNADATECKLTKSVYILRPCMIHGPGNKGNLNLLYKVVSKGIPWPLGAFENRRTFTSVENICFAVDGLLTKEVESGIYNMGDDEALSTNELIELICQALGKKPRIWHLSKGFMNLVAKVGGWLHLPLNPDRLQKLTENYVSSNAKIKAALGVDQMPVRAKDGLAFTLKCFEKK